MGAKKTISLLLVDDHSLFRESLSRLLEAEPDLEMVANCPSGKDALALLAAVRVDLVLLDHDLGDMNGLGFLEAAKKLGFAGKILFVTAGMSDVETLHAFERGASGIFLKHSLPADLLRAIRRVAEGETWLDPKAVRSLVTAANAAANIAQEKTQPISAFTARERSVLDGIFNGLTNKEIATKLNLSEGYVKAVLQQLFSKTGVRTRSQLVRIALEGQFSGDGNTD